ncbi:type II secretion system inner membrane protein GspF [Pelovirga terrestris]|uniref:General secretion pathway protein F n=1 Tax=Pelovirga terrestris TaxID=2771352 RepID=A0A8J6UIA3_9BACT|nr:type II secretion system inner membrane protein GspF [Pelovirga terrestris]
MALFEYHALDANGKARRGVVEALSSNAASRKLREQGLFPTKLKGAREMTAGTTGTSLFRRVTVLELGVATRQLSVMLSAGMPLADAMAAVAEQQGRGELGSVLSRVRDDVLQGSSLHNALGAHPQIFQPLYISMVQVGEASGTLDKVLMQLADFMDEQSRFNSQLKAAMTYPILMFLVGTSVLVFLMTFVVPKITRMLEDLEQVLPLPTRLLMGFAEFLTGYWWVLLLAVALVFWVGHRYSVTNRGRLWFDRKKFDLPLIGSLALHKATARFARTTATLLHSGVPLLTTLQIVERLLGNNFLQQAVAEVREKVTQGAGLAVPLRDTGAFPPMLAQMAAVGERSGELEGLLFRVADIYEHQVQTKLNGLMALLEPLMIIFMGGVVGFIVLAVLLPIFQASQGMG